MANPEHLVILTQGVDAWNTWRKEHAEIRPDLSRADLTEANLTEANLTEANLSGADLRNADLSRADLSRADLKRAILRGADLKRANLSRAHLYEAILQAAHLSRADLSNADLYHANLRNADLSGADLTEAHLASAYLSRADLSRADLSRADLSRATLVETNLQEAILTECSIYGISAWNIRLEKAKQQNLIITPPEEAAVTVDDLEVAQFIYLLLNNQKIRYVIDTLTTKSVLILGRFTPERKAVLDALREALRIHGFLPILFDFEKPASRDITEMVSTLAHLARFVIADITDARSIPQELMSIVPNLPSVAVQPLILNSQHEYGMFEHFTRFSWVLPVYRYTDEESLLRVLKEKVITPAEQKAQELAKH